MRIARAPGRVNLIGDHTDYTGGLVFPMAIDRWTDVWFEPADRIELTSTDDTEPVSLPLRVDDPKAVSPAWGRYVAGVVSEMSPTSGIRGHVTTTIPIGGGMSSSHALEVAVALALGFEGSVVELAQLTQRAENRASGVPTGIMDQFSIAGGVAGHALLMDCGALTITPVPMPDDVDVMVQFIAHRTLVGSAYADRVSECATAEALIGPLRTASSAAAASIDDPIVRKRAMHVVAENQRVRDFAEALRTHDLIGAGDLMLASHSSLRDLYDTSTAQMDAAVAHVASLPGVYGARMTGGGFGGCIVALTEPGALHEGWKVSAVDGAALMDTDDTPNDTERTGVGT